MLHHIIYWQMAKRETDVDETALAALREVERRGEAYIEFLDGQRLPHIWDPRSHTWRATGRERAVAA
jgi:hypothetical protein